GWRPLLEHTIPTMFGWIEATGQRPQEPGRRIYFRAIEELLNRLSLTIESVVANQLADRRFELDAYENVAEQLAGLLDKGILPAQLLDRSAADRRAIILAGWFRAFREHGDDAAALA